MSIRGARLQAGVHAAGVGELDADLVAHRQALDRAAHRGGHVRPSHRVAAPLQDGQQRARRARLGQRAPVLEGPATKQ